MSVVCLALHDFVLLRPLTMFGSRLISIHFARGS